MYRSNADTVLAVVLGTATVLCASIVVLILAFVAWEARPALERIGLVRLMTDDAWRPTGGSDARFGVTPLLCGSLLVTAGSLVLAAPLGTVSAVFSRFYAPEWIAAQYRRLIELLNGVPSVVFGFWGLVVLVPLINRIQPPGQSLLAGVVVLTLMILPTVALTAEGALRSVPRDYFQAAAALGLGRWATVSRIAVPAARGGIFAGVLLAAARAVGETMAVVMVCGNVVQVPSSLFDPVRTVTANIALEMGYATQAHRSALFVTGLMLMVLIVAVLLVVELLRVRRDHD